MYTQQVWYCYSHPKRSEAEECPVRAAENTELITVVMLEVAVHSMEKPPKPAIGHISVSTHRKKGTHTILYQ